VWWEGPKLNGILTVIIILYIVIIIIIIMTYDLGLKAVTAQLSNSNTFPSGRQGDLGPVTTGCRGCICVHKTDR
jgi:hypothetical protein